MKKRLFSLFFCILILLSLCSCDLSREKNYQGSMDIPKDGIILESVLSQIKDDHAVVTFKGENNGYHYEWTVFGDEITDIRDLNLGVKFDKQQSKDEITFTYCETKDFGFSPVISIYLNSTWESDTATVYKNNKAICGASVTKGKSSILNYAVSDNIGSFTIKADNNIEETTSAHKNGNNKNKYNSTNVNEDEYLSQSGNGNSNNNSSNNENSNKQNSGGNRVYSDGKDTKKDKYKTDPVPAGKPKPVEPENQEVNKKKTYKCTFSIECSSILNNISDLDPEKLDVVPSNGIILSKRTVTFYEGESVYDVLQRVCKENKIHLEASWTPVYNSAYVEGINNLYEFDCGSGSGWMYRVNGWYPNYGCSRYQLIDGEEVEWRYTCDLGKDIGGGYAIGG